MTLNDEQLGNAPQTSAERSMDWRRLGWLALPLAIFALMAIMLSFALRSGDPSRLPSVLVGKPAPAYDFPPLDGLSRDGRQVPGFARGDRTHGAPTVVNFFASWCTPCLQEHPVLKKLKADTGVRMVGINYKDRAPGGLRFLTRLGNPFDLVGTDNDGRGALEWGVYGMPETFILDGKGNIVYKHVGPIGEVDLQQKIIPVIKHIGG